MRSRQERLFILVILFTILLAMWVGLSYAADVTLAWDPNSETDLAGYKVYKAPQAGGPYSLVKEIPLASLADVAAPRYTVTDLINSTYYFVVTAYNTGAAESGYSNEVNSTINEPPIIPKGLRVLVIVDADGKVMVEVTNN